MPLLQHKVFKLLGVRHSAHAIVLFHQLVAGTNVSGRHLFLRRELVFDDFEYPIKARQREHQHHHATNTRRFNELLITGLEINEIFAVAFGFGVLLAADSHIQFSGGFTWQNFP